MEWSGLADVGFDYRVKVAVERGYPVYASVPERANPGDQANAVRAVKAAMPG